MMITPAETIVTEARAATDTMAKTRDTTVRASQAVQTLPTHRCETCRAAIRGRRHKKYCDATCQSKAYRVREKQHVLRIVRDIRDAVDKLEALVRPK